MGSSTAFAVSPKRATLTGAVSIAALFAGLPAAHAEPCLNVVTVSRSVVCLVGAESIYCSAGRVGGFQNAPEPRTDFITSVARDGSFQWIRAGGLGTCGNKPEVLDYGVTRNIYNWIVQPEQSGTRFTNAGSGRGMFVSIQSVSWF